MVWPKLLLEEGEQNGDHNSGFYRLTEDNEEDWDGEDIRHSGGESPDRADEGKSGLQRLQFQFNGSGHLRKVCELAELERCGII